MKTLSKSAVALCLCLTAPALSLNAAGPAGAASRPAHQDTDALDSCRDQGRLQLVIRPQQIPCGLQITEVMPGWPGHQAGLEECDVIVECNGQRIQHIRDLQRVLQGMKPGQKACLYVRDIRTGGYQMIEVRPRQCKIGIRGQTVEVPDYVPSDSCRDHCP